jgi:hypothetical protein
MSKDDIVKLLGEPDKAFEFSRDSDPADDTPDQAAFRVRDRKIAEALCPNGCGPMTIDGNRQDCPQCGFSHVRFTVTQ